jgi:hypothetical protein
MEMNNIDQHINAIMTEIGEIANESNPTMNGSKLDQLNLDSAKILVKEIHLCIMRHTYRVDNIRHNYNTLEDLL